jgi:pimeloyl-ACP methyl ester carboxylesterase
MMHLNDLPLAPGIRSRLIPDINGLQMHVLEAGFEYGADRPCLLLLHGFPELAYSWRHIMLPLAAAGFHVIAPDQRGYGRTTGWHAQHDDDPSDYSMPNLVNDMLVLVTALGYKRVASVIGHDFGSPVAAWCSLMRPDVFASVVMMSAPFGGAPLQLDPELNVLDSFAKLKQAVADLALLSPPRQHYQWFYSSTQANADMMRSPQGLHAFLRAYYHMKSADWSGNRPYPLAAMDAASLALLPTYYVMHRDVGMAATVAAEMPDAQHIAACNWLTEAELAIYVNEFTRTGFQGGLQWYRCGTDGQQIDRLREFGGRHIDIPACFIAGENDWGIYQMPGALEKMQQHVCTQMLDFQLIEGAGHWVQQEQPRQVIDILLKFLARTQNVDIPQG